MNFATLEKHIKKTLFETRSDEKKKTFASVFRTTKSMVTWTPDSKMLKITIEKMHNTTVGWFFDFKESPTQPRNLLLPLSPLPGFHIRLAILPFFRIPCSVAIFLISKPLYSSFSQFNSGYNPKYWPQISHNAMFWIWRYFNLFQMGIRSL